VVANVGLVEPAPVVSHEVAHPGARVGRILQERQGAVDDRRPDLFVAAAGEFERDDGESGDVVDAVTARAVRNDSVRMLHDARVVDEGAQMIDPDAHELRIDGGGRSTARGTFDGLAQHRRGRLGDGRPCELVADSPRLGPRRCQPLGLSRAATSPGVSSLSRRGIGRGFLSTG
jgi:hypothetical protein